MLAAAYGAGQVAFDLLWFFLFLVEVWLMVTIFVDIFRSHDLRGWAKALWVIFVLLIPLVGILAYLIFRGDRMRAHQIQSSGWSDRSGGGRWGGWAPGGSGAGGRPRSAHDVIESLHKLTELRDRGELSPEQYRRLRDELLEGQDEPPPGRDG